MQISYFDSFRLCRMWQVREFVRASGNLQGTKWRKFDNLATGKSYPSLTKALTAGFRPVEDVD